MKRAFASVAPIGLVVFMAIVRVLSEECLTRATTIFTPSSVAWNETFDNSFSGGFLRDTPIRIGALTQIKFQTIAPNLAPLTRRE